MAAKKRKPRCRDCRGAGLVLVEPMTGGLTMKMTCKSCKGTGGTKRLLASQ